jgi:hypothetical protein
MRIQRINETSLRPPTSIQQQPVALINFLLNNAGAIEKGPAERERESVQACWFKLLNV